MVHVIWSNQQHRYVVQLELTREQALKVADSGVLPAHLVADILAATELVAERNIAARV